jgi:hypothetical protein
VPAARRNRLKPANAIPITKWPVEPSNPWPVTLPVNSHLASQLACGEGVAATGLHYPAPGNQPALPDQLETRLAQIADNLTLNSGAAILP